MANVPYSNWTVAQRIPAAPMNQPFWQSWFDRYRMHQNRTSPIYRMPADVQLNRWVTIFTSEIWIPPWAEGFSFGIWWKAVTYHYEKPLEIRMTIGSASGTATSGTEPNRRAADTWYHMRANFPIDKTERDTVVACDMFVVNTLIFASLGNTIRPRDYPVVQSKSAWYWYAEAP
jgi:hypothetical protein